MSNKGTDGLGHGCALALGAAAVLAGSGAAFGQAEFHEPFDDLGASGAQDGPSALIARGWVFRNQSNPEGAQSWTAGTAGSGSPGPQAGSGYMSVGSASTDYFGGRVSNWAILPDIPGQQAGDELTFYALDVGGSNSPIIEVRYSPTGAIDTGSTADSVGSFAQVLLEIDPIPAGAGWNRYTVSLPGDGRIALRYFIADACNWGCYAAYTGIDSLSVGDEPPSPCNLPPLPAAGQTVTWTAAGGPYRVCENIGIPTGATVNVEPGVVIEFENDRQLVVSGTLNVNGNDGAPVTLDGTDNFPPYIVVQGGTLEAHHADFGQQLRVNAGATVRLYDSAFTSDGTNLRGGMMIVQELQDPEPFVVMERCTFTDSLLWLSDCRSVLRDNTFVRTTPQVLRGFADITATNTLDGAPMSITLEDAIQPFFVDGVAASNAPGAGLVLGGGGDFFIGPSTTLTGNGYPVELEGGLLPGSAVPPTGNASDKILASASGAARRWADLGVPYLLNSSAVGGGLLTIDPGVTVEAQPQTGWAFLATNGLIADGTPEAPITFRGENGGPWLGMQFAHNHGARLEYVTIKDANFGVIASDAPAVYLQNSTLRGNAVGGNANSYGGLFVEKTRILDNSVGLSVSGLGGMFVVGGSVPSAFEGNGAAIDAFDFGSDADAVGNWWGDASGPQHPSNPGGQGDPIIGPGAGGVTFQPFLTSPPNFADTPPLVRMRDPDFRTFGAGVGGYFEPGEKVILSWTAEDDEAIASQRIRVAREGHFPGAFNHTIADGLDPASRAFEMTVPDVGFAVTNAPQYLRIGSTDAAGQEGWDETPITISSMRITGALTIETDLAGQTYYPGDEIPSMSWSGSVSDFPSFTPYILFEADGGAIAGHFNGDFFGGFPHVSTDAARLALQVRNNSNDVRWFFAPGYFTVRHDPRFGFVAPSVQLQTPAAGASFAGGSTVPITWTASDPDDGLRSFDIQASFNGGKTWRLIARDLPGTARSYDWRLPPSTGIPDVRVRVIARDARFQNSTSGHDRAFAILPGTGCAADFNGSGTLDVGDFTAFRAAYLAGDMAADFSGDGMLSVADFTSFRAAYLAGCP